MYKLYNGDCLEVMDKLIEEGVKVDCILTDPPYGINFKSNHRKEKYSYIENDNNLDFIKNYFSRCYALLKEDTHIYCFCSWHNIDKFKIEFEKYFKLKNIIVWEKNNTSMGDLKGSYAPKHEFILYGHKGRRLRNGFRYADIIKANRTNNKLHPTQKPVDLLEIFIKQSTDKNDVVFDGFMGSGSTGVACMNTNRKFIGIELDNNYFNIASKRIEEAYFNAQNKEGAINE